VVELWGPVPVLPAGEFAPFVGVGVPESDCPGWAGGLTTGVVGAFWPTGVLRKPWILSISGLCGIAAVMVIG